MNQEDKPHVLVINEPGEDYEIEHPSTCKRIERWKGVWDYDCMTNACAEGIEFASTEGREEGWKHLPIGRYVLQAGVEHTPSLPTNGGEEWDLWLHIGPALSETDGAKI